MHPASSPLSLALLLFMSLLFCVEYFFSIPLHSISFHYPSLLSHQQYYRILTSTLSHATAIHIGMNLYSLYQLSILEELESTLIYANLSILILLTENILLFLFCCIVASSSRLSNSTWLAPVLSTHTVGYSGVLFGLTTYFAFSHPSWTASFFGLTVPFWTSPFINLVIITVIVPQASFSGHVSGIIGGIVWWAIGVQRLGGIGFAVILSVVIGVSVWSYMAYGRKSEQPQGDEVVMVGVLAPRIERKYSQVPSSGSSSWSGVTSGNSSGRTMIRGGQIERV